MVIVRGSLGDITGVGQQGVFRLSGDKPKIDQLKKEIDAGEYFNPSTENIRRKT